MDRGTLLQLRNLVNRRSVSCDTSNRFNASVDFFEMAVQCHIIAATLNYFGMESIDGKPTFNCFSNKMAVEEQWKQLQKAVSKIIDRFVVTQNFSEGTSFSSADAHLKERVLADHSYAQSCSVRSTETQTGGFLAEHSYAQLVQRRPTTRCLPQSIKACCDYPTPSVNAKNVVADKVME